MQPGFLSAHKSETCIEAGLIMININLVYMVFSILFSQEEHHATSINACS
jgi:hypothetical protein